MDKRYYIAYGSNLNVYQMRYRCPNARIIGADSSEDMLASAQKNHPDIEFIKLDAEKDLDAVYDRYDVVFSNACIQWIPEHRKLLRNMFNLLNDNGVLAIQTPQQSKHPVHGVITLLRIRKSGEKKFRAKEFFIILPRTNILKRRSSMSVPKCRVTASWEIRRSCILTASALKGGKNGGKKVNFFL